MTKPLESYTEKAFSLLGGKLPEIVYVPPSLRTRSMQAGEATKGEDQIDRVVAADPLGFLFAIMEGKALASFTVKPINNQTPKPKRDRGRPKKETATAEMKLGEENGHAYYAAFHSPTVADRERVAMFLSKLIASNRDERRESQPEDNDFARLCAKRAEQAKPADTE
jgi:hypothetical protein